MDKWFIVSSSNFSLRDEGQCWPLQLPTIFVDLKHIYTQFAILGSNKLRNQMLNCVDFFSITDNRFSLSSHYLWSEALKKLVTIFNQFYLLFFFFNFILFGRLSRAEKREEDGERNEMEDIER